MKTKNRNVYKLTISLGLIMLLVFQFCFGETDAFALSVEEEKIAGEKFLAKIRKHFDLVDDDFASEYINDLGHYLIRPLETKHFHFRFYIIKDNTINAFAGPGGHIFIFSGLIEVMDEIDELAAVICHEIGHVSARHLAQRIEQNKKIGIATMAGVLAAILIGGKAAGAIMTGSMAANIQAQLNYSRNDERQADQLGFKYMDESSFDPSAMITTLKNLHKGQWVGTDGIPPYLLTHPGGPERISNNESMLTGYIPKPGNRQTAKYRELFPFLKTILRARYFDPHEAERFFNAEIEKDPESILAHLGLGVVWKKRSEYDLAIDHFQKALKGKPDSPYILRSLGEVYQLKGQDTKAIKVLEKALKIDNLDRASLYLLAVSYQNLEAYPEAIRIYERLTVMEPVKDEVFYNLGVSYGRQDRLALAHYNSGIYFKRVRKMQEARFHFLKADELAKNDSALRNRIHKAMEGLAP